MVPKKTWGIVLTIFGAILSISAIIGLYETAFYKHEIESSIRLVEKYEDKFARKFLDADHARDTIAKQR